MNTAILAFINHITSNKSIENIVSAVNSIYQTPIIKRDFALPIVHIHSTQFQGHLNQ